MDTTQLLMNPVYHWYPANIYHKTFHKPPSVNDDGYTHKSPAPTTTNVCSHCGQVISVVEDDYQQDSLTPRQQVGLGIVVTMLLVTLFVVGANKLFNE